MLWVSASAADWSGWQLQAGPQREATAGGFHDPLGQAAEVPGPFGRTLKGTQRHTGMNNMALASPSEPGAQLSELERPQFYKAGGGSPSPRSHSPFSPAARWEPAACAQRLSNFSRINAAPQTPLQQEPPPTVIFLELGGFEEKTSVLGRASTFQASTLIISFAFSSNCEELRLSKVMWPRSQSWQVTD